uniref:Uncharacterized protein n=1 Tax=Strongyloides venezuelensis TaxID=75913 RepID=A0A0K0G471_STRVS
MKSLRKFGLFEKNESNLLIMKIIMDILIGNPLLQYESTSTETIKTIFIQILNHLNQHGFFNLKNRCNGKDVKLHFKGVGELTVLEKEFIRKLYDKKKIKNGLADEINDNGYYLEDSIKCLKCGKEHKYPIRCDIYSRELFIGSDL